MSDAHATLPAATADGAARRAALEAPATAGGGTTVDYRSQGRLLLLGPEAAVLDAVARVPADLDAYVLLTDDAGPSLAHPDVGQLGGRVRRGQPRALAGHLGEFRLAVADGDGERDLAVAFGLEPEQAFDLVLDLGDPPLLQRQLDPPGYFRPGPSGDADAALRAAAALVGEFEKPRYFSYDPDICVHGARGQRGCTRCLDACATEAIRSVGERIEVDPYLCQGCGSCATTCPTGAIAYAWPPVEQLLERVREMLGRYREAGGSDPLVLFHDGEAGAAALAEWSPDLPESVLPVTVEDAGSVGLDTWLTTLAYGAGRAVTLLPDTMPASERDTTLEQVALGNAMLRGLDLPADRIATIAPGGRLDAIAETPPPLAAEPARFTALGNKREVVRKALLHLHAAAGAPTQVTPLPAGAPYGDVEVDGDACTLCMACVSVCPTQALNGGGEQPLLSFREDRCVQCGLCERTCPEDAITLAPRLNFGALAEPQAETRHQEEPHHCPGCGKPFGTRKLIERMQRRLGEHWMFGDAEARRRLELCEDCRVEAVLRDEGSIDPYRGK
ncbi:MAG: 4Fe-4S binding protein [Halofilum sp. (in: g-proteobacteria)]|nr:4Fe-4S binding protein [Halofilum sp. (in: g-proteobacteria)]